MTYPVAFEVTPPEEFDKAQVVLRVAIVVVLSFLHTVNIIFAPYLLLPVLAAFLISQKGPTQYLEEA